MALSSGKGMKNKPMFLTESFFWKQIPNLYFSLVNIQPGLWVQYLMNQNWNLWKTEILFLNFLYNCALPLIVVKILWKYLPNKSNYPTAMFHLLSYQRKIGFFLLVSFFLVLNCISFCLSWCSFIHLFADFLSAFYVPSFNKQQIRQTSPCSHGANVWARNMDNRSRISYNGSVCSKMWVLWHRAPDLVWGNGPEAFRRGGDS